MSDHLKAARARLREGAQQLDYLAKIDPNDAAPEGSKVARELIERYGRLGAGWVLEAALAALQAGHEGRPNADLDPQTVARNAMIRGGYRLLCADPRHHFKGVAGKANNRSIYRALASQFKVSVETIKRVVENRNGS